MAARWRQKEMRMDGNKEQGHRARTDGVGLTLCTAEGQDGLHILSRLLQLLGAKWTEGEGGPY